MPQNPRARSARRESRQSFVERLARRGVQLCQQQQTQGHLRKQARTAHRKLIVASGGCEGPSLDSGRLVRDWRAWHVRVDLDEDTFSRPYGAKITLANYPALKRRTNIRRRLAGRVRPPVGMRERFIRFRIYFMRPVFDWVIGSRTLQLGKRTLIMGVVNVTPDSFSDGGRISIPIAPWIMRSNCCRTALTLLTWAANRRARERRSRERKPVRR